MSPCQDSASRSSCAAAGRHETARHDANRRDDPSHRARSRVRPARVRGALVPRGARAQDGARPVDRVGGDRRAAGRPASWSSRRATATPRAPGAIGRPPVLVALDRAAGRRRSGSTSASATCASRSPTSRTRCWPSATSGSTPTCPPRRRSRSPTRLVEEVLDEAGARSAEIVGVGMGLPGPVHRPHRASSGDSTILPGWVGVRAADAMSAALGHRRSRSRTTRASARSASGCGAPGAARTTWPTSSSPPASARA